MSKIRCESCGAEIPGDSKFCMQCGYKIEASKETQEESHPSKLMHYAYGNNQSCGGKSNILIRNGFVYYIKKATDEIKINVSPVSDETMIQTLYMCKGPGCTASCLNMVNDELIFYEYADGHKITALDIYSGERRIILENHQASSIWIENMILTFVENGNLHSIKTTGTEYYEYSFSEKFSDRVFGYSGNLYAIIKDTRMVVEIPYYGSAFKELNFPAGEDMLYAVIGNLYYSPAPSDDESGKVLICQNLETLDATDGIQDISRMITAFEQYVIFSRENEKDFSFAWNVQTLRVYRLNRYVDLPPYSFTQTLSDYIFAQYGNKLYKISAPVFFQGSEPMFETDKYLFAEL